MQTIPADSRATASAPAAIPNEADLNPRFERWGLSTRPQGNRPTCSVFTVTGALEYALASRVGQGTLLSVDFLNWACQQATGRETDGAFFWQLWAGYEQYGICPESDMPYAAAFDPERDPSAEARDRAQRRSKLARRLHWIKEWDVNTGLTDEQFLGVKRALADGFPVCGGFRWPKKATWTNGVLDMCPASDVFDGHSVLLSGYCDDPSGTGGVFAIRNSGGSDRAGFLTYEYACAYMNDAAIIEPAP